MIEVDYSRDFLDLACEAGRNILAGGGWDLLRMANHKRKHTDWPSWLPDWSSPQKHTWFTLDNQRLPKAAEGIMLYRECPGDAICLHDDRRSLVLQGHILGSVVASSADYINEDPESECYKAYTKEDIGPEKFVTCGDHFYQRISSWIDACTSHFKDVDFNEQLVSLLCRFALSYYTTRDPRYEGKLRESHLLSGGSRLWNDELCYPGLEINHWLRRHSISLTSNGFLVANLERL
ncbi:hypothetical protein BCR34DRAFT_10033 [Clohesyomyces aquaticus]|uniref:Uncharacterized protein n=1 Tax=Clohesyomyces aquaticus TaxID=1231657 RepID=A0A1Y2A5N6_9PLEO|nr:hypothetical protein BCR34DRAFT_10033 [Clohesyomyces aquaticus]